MKNLGEKWKNFIRSDKNKYDLQKRNEKVIKKKRMRMMETE